MQRRQRVKHKATFEERLSAEAQRLRELARTVSPGQERERLIRRTRQAETASHISEWVSSAGPEAPK